MHYMSSFIMGPTYSVVTVPKIRKRFSFGRTTAVSVLVMGKNDFSGTQKLLLWLLISQDRPNTDGFLAYLLSNKSKIGCFLTILAHK